MERFPFSSCLSLFGFFRFLHLSKWRRKRAGGGFLGHDTFMEKGTWSTRKWSTCRVDGNFYALINRSNNGDKDRVGSHLGEIPFKKRLLFSWSLFYGMGSLVRRIKDCRVIDSNVDKLNACSMMGGWVQKLPPPPKTPVYARAIIIRSITTQVFSS